MAGKVRKRAAPHRIAVWVIVGIGVIASAYAFSAEYGSKYGQLAEGGAADMQCMGGADAKCQCKTGLKNGKCDPKTKGGGKIGCECVDVTNGFPTTGKCATVGKCKGEKTDGMPPMLPMLPMMMPMMMMPMMPSCPPKTSTTTQCTFRDASYDEGKTTEGTSTDGLCLPSGTCSERTGYIASFRCTSGKWVSSTSTEAQEAASAIVRKDGSFDPNCSQSGSGVGGFDGGTGSYWYPDYGSGDTSGSGSGSGSDDGTDNGSGSGSGNSVWERLMNSLGLGSDSGSDNGDGNDNGNGNGGIDYNGTSTGHVNSQGNQNQGFHGSTTYNGRFVGTQTFVTNDLADQDQTGTYTYHGAAETFVNGTAQILANIKNALLRLLAILLSLIHGGRS